MIQTKKTHTFSRIQIRKAHTFSRISLLFPQKSINLTHNLITFLPPFLLTFASEKNERNQTYGKDY